MHPYYSFSSSKNKTVPSASVAVDKDDAVYVLREDKTLSVYSANRRNVPRSAPLTFFGYFRRMPAITVTKDKSIFIAWEAGRKDVTMMNIIPG